MEAERIEAAVQRIEQALARIADIAEREPVEPAMVAASEPAPDAVADTAPAMSRNVSQLVDLHEKLRETVVVELKRIDGIIERLER